MKFRRRMSALSVIFFLQVAAPSQALEKNAEQSEQPEKRLLLWYRNYDSPPVRSLVSLALEKTPEYPSYILARSPEMSQGRVIRELENPHSEILDIANLASNAGREKKLTAIPVPIDGGLLGLRVCVVKQENLPKFEGIDTLQKLARSDIRIGQGAHWPDSDILKLNEIEVVTHSRYDILFRMLDNDRFECFARGVSEAFYELRLKNDSEYVIEPNLLLAYDIPSALFVKKENQQLAHRLQLGIERAIQDGTFAAYLDRYYGKPIRELNLGSRRILALDNPLPSMDSRKIGQRTLQDLRARIDRIRD